MIKELEQLLKEKTLTIIVGERGDTISLTVIPKTKDGKSEESDLPLNITGTAEELDKILSSELTTYTAEIAGATSNIKQIKAMAEKAKLKAQEEAKANKARKTATSPTSPSSASAQSATPAAAKGDNENIEEEDTDEDGNAPNDLFSRIA